MEQDRLGNMWLGTRNGLNRYNGHKFDVFKNDRNDPKTISNSSILSILEDSDGYIWVGTYNGLNKYDPVANTFKRYYFQDGDNSLANNVVVCSKEMPNGEIWFGTGNGVSIYSKVNDDFKNITYSENNKQGIPNKTIQHIFLDSSNQVWIATSGGLAKLTSRKENQFTFKQYRQKKNNQSLFIQDIIEIKSSVLGLATKYNGLVLFNKILEAFEFNAYPDVSGNDDTRALQLANDGNLWVGTVNGVKIITPEKKVYHIKSNSYSSEGLSQNFINSIFKDNNGSIWLGTYNGGANIWNAVNENFINFKNNTLDNNVVSSIISDSDSNLYFGTVGGNITILNPKLNTPEVLTIYDDKKLKSLPIQTLLHVEPNLLWVGVLNHGLFVYDLKNKRKLTDVVSEELKDYLEKTGVYVIKKDSNGIYWFGTFGKGLVRYDATSKTFRVFGHSLGEKPNLSTNIIKTVLPDSKGNIWAGGLGGLNLISFKDEYSFKVSNYFLEEFSENNINTVYEDSNNNIWVGTNASGLHKFNDSGFEKITLDSQTPITAVFTILENQQGHLYLSSDRGIIKYEPINNISTIYNQESLDNSNEFKPNSGFRLGTSQFYFGGTEGVTTFNANKLVKNHFTPKVVLSDLKIKNESVKIGRDKDVLSKHISYTKAITLSYDNSNFSIEYSMPSFINSEKNQYAYRLVGLDESWVYTSNTEAYYTLQNPGTYIFEVKGANNDGVWNKTPTTLSITVKPAPWLSGWAYALYALIIILSFYGLIWIIQSKTKLKNELKFEHIESEKNKEINQAKLEFFTNISHEFRTPLALILGPLQQILLDYDGNNAIYKRLLTIESSSNHLLRLINRLMDFRKLETNQFHLEAAEGNIVKFLQEIYLSFTEFSKVGNYTYTFNSTDDKILVYYDRYKLERVFYNLISNAFRYTPEGGKISVNVTKTDESICITVEDSGVGIKEEHLEKIFDRFFEVSIHNKPEKNYNKGTGIGLSIANNIVKLHHGEITVRNQMEQGVIFEVILPLGNAHLSENEILSDFKISDDIMQYESQLNGNEVTLETDVTDFILVEEKATLLIVEDNKPLRSFMKNLLKKNYNVLEAENGKIAMKKAIKHVPDLIISDVIMPEMVGTELCANIKENIKTSHIPVILLTSRTSLVYKVEGLESGADDYISKPFNLKEFELRIRNLLETTRRFKNKFSSDDNFVPSEITVSSLDQELLKKAFKIVEDNISNEQFDVPLFCSELGISRSLLFTKVKAWTNLTPNNFIQEIRLKSAAQLLEKNIINISQISYKVGFRNPKYFSECFKKKYGLTPKQYQNKFS
jgi:signal transduction histidine kinase/ligand-binding sensor domain-containing protein/DNA-binding response OmpR family regulator